MVGAGTSDGIPVLEELEITDLGIISRASLPLGPGFNVLTGETGAGKTMVLTSVQLITGARGSASVVASGASRCEVVATFGVDSHWASQHREELDERGALLDLREDASQGLIISRELNSLGRSKAFLGGKQVPLGVLSEFCDQLIAVHGQAEQSKLRDPNTQLDLLDRAGGPERTQQRERFRSARKTWRALVRRRQQLTTDRGDNELRAQMLELGLAEIAEVAPREGEDMDLRTTLSVMRHAEAIRAHVDSVRARLSQDSPNSPAITSAVAATMKELAQANELDPDLGVFQQRLGSILEELIDVDAELSDHARALNSDPHHLESMEQRLAAIKALMKKFGPHISDVLEWATQAERELPRLQFSDQDMEELDREIAQARTELVESASALTAARSVTAQELAQRVQAELVHLAMPHARIRIVLSSPDKPEAWPATGADTVEFTIAAHGNDDFRPLGSSVSGGELSRLMLALEVVLAEQDPVPTMIFDEVDAGIGGEVAVEVGRRLARLAEHLQVIVVTHLPQVAAFADRHFVVTKSADSGEVSTTLTEVAGENRIREITRMLSGLPDSSSGAAHAEELLALGQHG